VRRPRLRPGRLLQVRRRPLLLLRLPLRPRPPRRRLSRTTGPSTSGSSPPSWLLASEANLADADYWPLLSLSRDALSYLDQVKVRRPRFLHRPAPKTGEGCLVVDLAPARACASARASHLARQLACPQRLEGELQTCRARTRLEVVCSRLEGGRRSFDRRLATRRADLARHLALPLACCRSSFTISPMSTTASWTL